MICSRYAWLKFIPEEKHVLRRILGADHKAIQRWWKQGIDLVVTGLGRGGDSGMAHGALHSSDDVTSRSTISAYHDDGRPAFGAEQPGNRTMGVPRMTGAIWQPLHSNHAIQEMVLSLEFDCPVSPEAFQSLMNGDSPFDGLPIRGVEQTQVFQIVLGAPTPISGVPSVSPGGLPGLNFDRTGGTAPVAERLMLRGPELSYVTTEYTRWNEVFGVALQHITTAYKVQPDRRVSAVALRYIDKFKAESANASMPSASLLFNPDGPFVSARALATTETCHSYCGYWKTLQAGGKALINLNLDVVDEQDAGRVAQVRTFVRQTYDDTDCFVLDTVGMARLRAVLEEVHAICIEIFRELLTEAMQSRVGLMQS